ncbi:hypothetical protein [Bradyrhizobium sp. SZCCHNS1054]|uniref:hypothetical protein n=1 Tax=Bradyrhizobium sp. SZCCHNS1054 TaxID=3057301 RepID=UPI0029169541|nr:hypothetical protein [Bradyrhizobium sp. SZCCHNS1054]
MEAAAISALAAWAAAIVAATGAGFQFFVGRKQATAALISANAALRNSENSGRHKKAEYRQAWINRVIDTLCDYHAIVSTVPPGEAASTDDERKLAGLRTKLAILLNPDEPDTVELLSEIEKLDAISTDADFAVAEAKMLAVSRRLLKREWVRIKEELA